MTKRREKKAKTKAARDHEAQAAQPPLIPMSEAETKAAGKKLAEKIKDLEAMEAEHKQERAERKDDRDALRSEIAAIASTIRNQGR